MRKLLIIVTIILTLMASAIVAAIIPIDTYTSEGCSQLEEQRLSVIQGDSIEEKKNERTFTDTGGGCGASVRYTLYLI